MDQAVEQALQQIRDGARARDLESYTLDFKQEARTESDTERLLRDEAICFANGDGGTIVVGVADDGAGPDAFIGSTLDAQQIQRRIYELTVPSLLVTSDEVSFGGHRLIVLGVPRGRS